MRRASAVAACCALGLCAMTPGQAQQQSQDFQLAFCNISAYSGVVVSLTYRQNNQQWQVDGWYPIPNNGCAVVGIFPRDSVYYYAVGLANDGRSVIWSAADNDQTGSSQCIDPDKFFRAFAGVPSCPAGQEPAKFKLIKVAPDVPRVTWTLTGG